MVTSQLLEFILACCEQDDDALLLLLLVLMFIVLFSGAIELDVDGVGASSSFDCNVWKFFVRCNWMLPVIDDDADRVRWLQSVTSDLKSIGTSLLSFQLFLWHNKLLFVSVSTGRVLSDSVLLAKLPHTPSVSIWLVSAWARLPSE